MYDCIIIGSGVTGTSIAYNLSKKEGNFLVIEKNEDVCTGTSKANTAIIHGGYDAKPETLKAKMNVWGSEICEDLSKEIGFAYDTIGSFVVCTDESEVEILKKLYDQGIKNNVKGMEILYREDLLKMEKNLSDDVYAALFCKSAAIVDPFLMNVAFAEVSYTNGVKYNFNEEVLDIYKENDYWIVKTNKEKYETKAVVNAAGVYGDKLHNLVSEDKLNIKARRGEYLLLDKETKGLVNHVVFDVPTDKGKGVVITPTMDGNTLVGPTANFVEDKEDTSTTRKQLDYITNQCEKTVKNIPLRSVITSFSGLRAHEEQGDFVLQETKENFFDAIGIESPGLSSAPAIGIYISQMVADKLNLKENENFNGHRDPIIKTSELSFDEHQKLIEKDPRYGQIICRCEKVTEGEIVDAINRPLGAKNLDGIKRRVRATAGRCQGGFCSPKIIEILARELDKDQKEIVKNNENSFILTSNTK